MRFLFLHTIKGQLKIEPTFISIIHVKIY